MICKTLIDTSKYDVTTVTRDLSQIAQFSDNLSGCNILCGNALDKSSIEPSLKNSKDIVISVGTTGTSTPSSDFFELYTLEFG